MTFFLHISTIHSIYDCSEVLEEMFALSHPVKLTLSPFEYSICKTGVNVTFRYR